MRSNPPRQWRQFDGKGRTPLHAAVKNGNVAVVMTLCRYLHISQLHLTNVQDFEERTPLYLAVEMASARKQRHNLQTRIAIISALVCNGADVDCIDSNGRTSSQLAILRQNEAVVSVLLRLGTSVSYNDIVAPTQSGCYKIAGMIRKAL